MPHHMTQLKIVRPEAEGSLLRSKLFNRFDEMHDRAMVWVAGPAGSGKTTAVSSYVADRRLNCIWYRVDEGDVDPETFFYFLGQAVAGTVKGGQPEDLPPFTTKSFQCVPGFSCNFFDRLSQKLSLPAVFVFDNIHHVPADALLHKAIIAGLNRLPSRVQVIMISRNPPPAVYSRLRANVELGMLGWQDLRLSHKECEAIVRLSLAGKSLPGKQLTSIHKLTAGWVAGVQFLLVKMIEGGAVNLSLPEQISKEILDYFSEEIFSQFDPNLQDFLLRSAFLPWIDRQLAEIKGDASNLDFLVQNNLFIETSGGNPPTFRYNPLFQEFLLHRAAVNYDPKTIRNMQLQDAQYLREGGYLEDAATLLVQARGWQQFADLIVQEAPGLVRQGRSRMVHGWLQQFPKAMFQKDTMLLYWQGVCCFPFDFERGREYLQQAYINFKESEDPDGLYLCCLAVIESLCQEIRTRPLTYWIGELNALLDEYPHIAVGRIESQVIKVMLPGYLFVQPQDPAVHVWAAMAEALLDNGVELSLELEISAYLALYYYWVGANEKMPALLLRLRSPTDFSEISPLSRLVMLNMEALCLIFLGDFQAAHLANEQGLSLAGSFGVKTLKTRSLLQGAYARLSQGDIDGAESLLKEIGSCISPGDVFNSGLFYHFSAMAAAGKGQLTDALFLITEASKFIEETHVPFNIAVCRIGHGQILTDLGNFAEAAVHLQKARKIGESMRSLTLDYICLLYESYLAFAQQRREKGYDLLKRGLAMGRQHSFIHTNWWVPHVVTGLCTKALEAGIESEYIRMLILRHQLDPPNPPITVENWPWPVRIYTLGRFELVLGGKPFRPRKTPEKPFALLKVLLALGGRQVPEMHLAEVLWPDAEGDLQYQTLKTNLHRLRTLLGVKDIVKHADRRVTLDPKQCWVDAWAFERLVDKANHLQNSGEIEMAMESCAMACRHYQGEFLSGEDHPYALASRRHMRLKFIMSAEMLGRHLETRHKVDEAVLLYERVLRHVPAEEKVYQRLINCHLQENRRAEAADAYKRCHQVLAADLGVAPSPATTALYNQVLSDKR